MHCETLTTEQKIINLNY